MTQREKNQPAHKGFKNNNFGWFKAALTLPNLTLSAVPVEVTQRDHITTLRLSTSSGWLIACQLCSCETLAKRARIKLRNNKDILTNHLVNNTVNVQWIHQTCYFYNRVSDPVFTQICQKKIYSRNHSKFVTILPTILTQGKF